MRGLSICIVFFAGGMFSTLLGSSLQLLANPEDPCQRWGKAKLQGQGKEGWVQRYTSVLTVLFCICTVERSYC